MPFRKDRKINQEIIRADAQFTKELREILEKRINLGKEDLRKLNGTRRFTKSIIRHKFWPLMKEDIIIADLENDRIK